jgi:hypothetical protein
MLEECERVITALSPDERAMFFELWLDGIFRPVGGGRLNVFVIHLGGLPGGPLHP